MKLSDILEAAEQGRRLFYWLGQDAKLIDVSEYGPLHFLYAIQHPTEFGISEEDVTELRKRYQTMHRMKELPSLNLLVDDDASDALMEKIYAHHWMRVSFDYTDWSVHCGRLDPKNRETLEKFARNLISNKYPIPAFFQSSRFDLTVYPLEPYSSEVTMEIGDIARGRLYEAHTK